MALFTVTATFAPAIGPLIGGWLTDNYGWPFIFYMNAIPGALMIAAVWFTMENQPMNLSLLKKGDWWGILTMAIGLAAFEIVLEDGNRKDWFGDPGIVKLAWTAAIFIPAFIIIELRQERAACRSAPLCAQKLRARQHRQCGSWNWPLWRRVHPALIPGADARLQRLSDRNGPHLAGSSATPCHPPGAEVDATCRYANHYRHRGSSVRRQLLSYCSSRFRILQGRSSISRLIIRALGQPLIMVPLSAVTTSGMAKGRESGAASALFNMMRNIGGSIGIAGLSTLLSVRERFHSERIGESVTVYSGAVQERMQQSTAYFLSQGSDSYSATCAQLALSAVLVRHEAFLLAYSDCFLVLGCVLLASAIRFVLYEKSTYLGCGWWRVIQGVTCHCFHKNRSDGELRDTWRTK